MAGDGGHVRGDGQGGERSKLVEGGEVVREGHGGEVNLGGRGQYGVGFVMKASCISASGAWFEARRSGHRPPVEHLTMTYHFVMVRRTPQRRRSSGVPRTMARRMVSSPADARPEEMAVLRIGDRQAGTAELLA